MDEKLNLVYEDQKGNVIYSGENVFYDLSLIVMTGSKNKIYIGSGSDLSKFRAVIKGNSHLIVVGQRCILKGTVNIKPGKMQCLRIGDETTFHGVSLHIAEGQSITIGRDCMFSAHIEIRTTDNHSVINVDTGERVNWGGSVVIGDHVWIGKDAIISKGVTLNSNIIVGAKAFVNRSFNEQYLAIAGVPAKIVKNRVDWRRDLIPRSDAEIKQV